MGVPRLFRWLAERYPLVLRDLPQQQQNASSSSSSSSSSSEGGSLQGLVFPDDAAALARAFQGQQQGGRTSSSSHHQQQQRDTVSNEVLAAAGAEAEPLLAINRMYLDFNGVVHHCSHGDGPSALSSAAKAQGNLSRALAHDIFAYLERLVDAAQPRDLLFIAIDGVAPRAKMNQQRQRRFRASSERAAHLAVLRRQRATRRRREREELAKAQAAAEVSASGVPEFSASSATPQPAEEGTPVDAASQESPAAPTQGDDADLDGNGDDDDDDEEFLDVFDSNCITPGTEFMTKLSEALSFFIQKKIASDPAWARLEVVLSGADVAGEGEHKISEFIRSEKRLKTYDPALTHCVYGLDADLMMLALASHEPNFVILREKVIFRSAAAADKRTVNFHQTDDFQILSVGILRQYLRMELMGGATGGEQSSVVVALSPSDEATFERKVDDFVFLCYLCGNDFLPALPFLDIGEDAIQHIFEAYRACSTRWKSGFLTDASYGSLNIDAFRDILEYLTAKFEAQKFSALARKAGVAGDAPVELVETVTVPQVVLQGAQTAPAKPTPTPTETPAETQKTPLPDAAARPAPATTGLASETDRQMATTGLKALLGVQDTIDPRSLLKPVEEVAAGELSSDLSSLLSDRSLLPSTTTKDDAVDPEDSEAMETQSEVGEDDAAAEAVVQEQSLLEKLAVAAAATSDSGSTQAEAQAPLRVQAAITVSGTKKFEFEFKKLFYEQRLLRGRFSAQVERKKGSKKSEAVDVGATVVDACLNYIEGLVWTFNYYYHGHLSWRWFYQVRLFSSSPPLRLERILTVFSVLVCGCISTTPLHSRVIS
jgi:5'-3' exoribonuclease 2